jgi:dipeptidyl aminopeptidase/acylaminoacyl peptidase
MKMFLALSLAFAASTLAQPPRAISAKHPFTFEDMMKLKRLDEPVPSPDGKWVIFSATDIDLEGNTKISHLWIVSARGGESRRLNESPNHEERPRFHWMANGSSGTSKATDPSQIWVCDFDAHSSVLVGKPHQMTTISTGADGAIWSPDGKNIVFVWAVYPDCKDDACNKQRDDERKSSKVKAKIFPRLFYRHWNWFTEFKRSRLFVVSADATVDTAHPTPTREANMTALSGHVSEGSPKTSSAPNEPCDLTPGDHDVPPFHLGGQDMYAISPDGQEVAYTSNIDEVEAATCRDS